MHVVDFYALRMGQGLYKGSDEYLVTKLEMDVCHANASKLISLQTKDGKIVYSDKIWSHICHMWSLEPKPKEVVKEYWLWDVEWNGFWQRDNAFLDEGGQRTDGTPKYSNWDAVKKQKVSGSFKKFKVSDGI